MDPQQFFRTLWGDPPPGVINIWRLPDRTSSWHRDLGSINSFLQQFAHEEVYTGVSLVDPHKGRFTTKNRIEEVAAGAIAGVWSDIDVFHQVHTKAERLPANREEAQEVMDQLPYEPTLIVDSGHGLQYWWLLEKPWVFENEAEWGEARRVTQWWHRQTKALFEARGWTTDSVFDLSRILRIPGTFNNKVKDDPKPVTAIKTGGPRYTVEDFTKLVPAEFVAKPPAPEQRRGRRGRASYEASTTASGLILDPEAQPNQVRLQSLLKANPKFQQSWDQNRRDMKDPSPSGYNMSMADIAIRAGWPEQEVVNLLICWRRIHGHDLKLRERYYDLTLDRAKEPIQMEREQEKLEEEPRAAGRASRTSGNRRRKTPEEWQEAWPEGLAPLTLVSTQWQGPCPGCLKRIGEGGDDRFHIDVLSPHAFGCRHCLDDKGKLSMEPYYAVFGRSKSNGKAATAKVIRGGAFHQVGAFIGAQLVSHWRYVDLARGPYWARYRGGIWEDLTTQDNSLIDWISANRLRIAGQLEEQGNADLGKKLAVDYLWNGQKHHGSDLWAGLRSECGGGVPDRARFHVATPGGCVDLRTGDMHQHRPECGQRGMTAGRYLPVEWPRLSAALADHLKLVFRPTVQMVFLELVGLSLTGEAANFRGLVLVTGDPRSGKGGIVELARISLGTRAGALGIDWFGRRSGDIDAETANLLHLEPDIIAVAEMGADSLSQRRKMLAALGGQDVLTARRPHGATIIGKVRGLGWSSCVEVPSFEVGSGIESRIVALPTLGTLPQIRRRSMDEMFTQELLDAVVTGGILGIREAGFFNDGYIPPGGDQDEATAKVLAAMDPWTAWLDRLPDSWSGRLVEEARREAMADIGDEISETLWGSRINRSPKWTKRRGEVAGVRGTRLYLQGNRQGSHGSDQEIDYEEHKEGKPDQTPATLAARSETPTAPAGDEQYFGPLPTFCPEHHILMVGAFCHACYREWQDQDRCPAPQPEDMPESSGEAHPGGVPRDPPVERCGIHMGYRMKNAICQICVHEDATADPG